jgi:hypothetical protein
MVLGQHPDKLGSHLRARSSCATVFGVWRGLRRQFQSRKYCTRLSKPARQFWISPLCNHRARSSSALVSISQILQTTMEVCDFVSHPPDGLGGKAMVSLMGIQTKRTCSCRPEKLYFLSFFQLLSLVTCPIFFR